MFALLLVAFFLLGSLGTGSFIKTMAMVILGLLLGTIGMDSLTGTLRFTFGIHDLYDGIGFVPVALGAFGFGEILYSTAESTVREVYKPRFRELLPNRKELRASWGPILRGSGIGFFIGLLPGSAHILASFVSYITEKRLAKGRRNSNGPHRRRRRAGNGQQCRHRRSHDPVLGVGDSN
jgi:putative tricarboxylic transport membrane protein